MDLITAAEFVVPIKLESIKISSYIFATSLLLFIRSCRCFISLIARSRSEHDSASIFEILRRVSSANF